MQARAIFEAAIEVGEKTGKTVVPEIMVPLVAIKAELDRVAALIDKAADGGRRRARAKRPTTSSAP